MVRAGAVGHVACCAINIAPVLVTPFTPWQRMRRVLAEWFMTKVVCVTFAQAIPLRIFVGDATYGYTDVAIGGEDNRFGWEVGEAVAV